MNNLGQYDFDQLIVDLQKELDVYKRALENIAKVNLRLVGSKEERQKNLQKIIDIWLLNAREELEREKYCEGNRK